MLPHEQRLAGGLHGGMDLKHSAFSWRIIWLPVLIIALGISLRLIFYDVHGLDGDDSYSLSLSRLDSATLFDGLMTARLDVRPPLHFFLLKGWITIAGVSLLALRSLNIFIDTLTGAFILALSRSAFGWRSSLLVGGLWIFSGGLFYSFYLVRMYSLAAMLLAGGCFAMLMAIRRGCWYWYGLTATYGLFAAYTHLVGLIGLAVISVIIVLFGRRLRALLWMGSAVILSVPVIQLIWSVYVSGRQLGAQMESPPFDTIGAAAQSVVNNLFLPRLSFYESIMSLVLGLICLCAIRLRWGRPLALAFALFVGGMVYLAYAQHIFKLYYLAPLIPLGLVVLVGGLMALPRSVRLPGLIGMVLLSTLSTIHAADFRIHDDWRSAAAFVQTHELPGDYVLVIPDWGANAFRYAYRGKADVVGVFPQVSRNVDYTDILAFLTKPHRRVWLVRYQTQVSDPQNLADEWMRDHAVTVTEVYPVHIQVKGYDFQPVEDQLPPYATPLNIPIEPGVQLAGIYLPEVAGSAQDDRLHPPSNWVQVILYWTALPSASPAIHLVDSLGQVYGGNLTRDNTLWNHRPQWKTGELVRQAYDVNLNPITPPGMYKLLVETQSGFVPIGSFEVH
jgi:hypothetical protein